MKTIVIISFYLLSVSFLSFDINGFPVTGWFVSYNSSTEVDIDLNALNPGVYLIRTNAVDGSTQVGRFIKQ